MVTLFYTLYRQTEYLLNNAYVPTKILKCGFNIEKSSRRRIKKRLKMVSDQKKDIEKFTAEDVNNIGKSKEKFDSPIDIKFSILSHISLPLLEWSNEHQPPRFMKLTNSGVSVILSGKWNGPRPFLRYGPLLGEYIFSQMHFHWGPLEEGGSEHTFDGVRMPLEMHVMFFKSEYLSQEEAMKNNDGILNLAFLTEEDDSIAFKPIVDNLYKIESAEMTHHIELLPLSHFFPPFVDDYYMYWGNVVNTHAVLWIICRRPLPISANQINCFRYIHNHNREMVKSNYRSTKPLQNGKIFHVNPEKLYNKHLIIPLSEILATKITKRSKPTKIIKIPRKKYNAVSVKKNKKNKESFKISDIHYCFGPSETDESDELDSSTENTPTMENTSMDESAIKIVFDSITNFKEGSETNIKSLLGKRDSLKEISKLFDLRQGSDESYSDFLERVEDYLKNIIAKVEAEKMKFLSDKNRYINKDDNLISLQAIKCTHNMILAENVKKIDAFTANAASDKTEEQLLLNKLSAPLEKDPINFPQSEKNTIQPPILLPVPKIELNQKRVNGSSEKVSGTKCEDLENTEQSFNRKRTPNAQLKSSPINKEKNAGLVSSQNNEQLKENHLNIRIQSEKLTPTTDTEIIKENDKNNKAEEMDSLISTDTIAIMSVDEKKTAISEDDFDDDITVEIPTVHKVQSSHYVKQPQLNPNKLKNIPSKALKQASHSSSRGGTEPPANKGAVKPEVDKFAKRRRPQLKSTLVTEIFIGQELLNPSISKQRPLSRKQQHPISSQRPTSTQQPISRQQPVSIKKPVSRQKPISSQQPISEQYSATKRPQIVTNVQKESAGKINKEVERSSVQTKSVTPNKPTWKY